MGMSLETKWLVIGKNISKCAASGDLRGAPAPWRPLSQTLGPEP